jgi:beta-galactosidase
MKKLPFYFLVTALLFSACKRYSKYEDISFTEKEPRDWEDPEMFSQNREAPHATMISFPDELSASEEIN